MAEAALKAELKKRRIAWFTITSAGLSAHVGAPMNPMAQQALTEAKISYSAAFKSKQLTREMVADACLVICMTQEQAQAIGGANVTSFFALAGREIPDPFGQSIDVYRATLRNIREYLPLIIEKLKSFEKEE